MKTAFLFSGQGSQMPGMFYELYNKEDSVKNVFRCADDILGRSITELCFNGSQDELNLTHNTQPCVLTADIAAAMVLKSYGINADGVAGFSLGEYAALVYANVIGMKDAISLIQKRADAMQNAVPVGVGAMAAIMSDDINNIEKICESIKEAYVAPANYNSPAQTVISGTKEGIDLAIAKLTSMGIKTIKLAVSAPFHCKLMEPASKYLADEFSKINFDNPTSSIYMNVTGKKLTEDEDLKDLLVKQSMSPVRWKETLENMYDDGFDTFIECGPGKTLAGLVKKTLKNVSVYRVEDLKSLDQILTLYQEK